VIIFHAKFFCNKITKIKSTCTLFATVAVFGVAATSAIQQANAKASYNANTVDNAANINKVIWNYASNQAQLKNVQQAQTVMDSLHLQ
jgi:hypothetical protein